MQNVHLWPADDEKENVDAKGKAPMRVEDLERDDAADEDEEDADEDDEGSDGPAADGEDGDMQLAWEMLEVARTIYANPGDARQLELAGVHFTLQSPQHGAPLMAITPCAVMLRPPACFGKYPGKYCARKLASAQLQLADMHHRLTLPQSTLKWPAGTAEVPREGRRGSCCGSIAASIRPAGDLTLEMA
jgi:hypothetical protein